MVIMVHRSKAALRQYQPRLRFQIPAAAAADAEIR